MGVQVPGGLDTLFYSPFTVAHNGATIDVDIAIALNNGSGVTAGLTYYVCLWTGYYQDYTGMYGGSNAIAAGFLQYAPGPSQQIVRAVATNLASGGYYLSLYVYNNHSYVEHQGTFASIKAYYS